LPGKKSSESKLIANNLHFAQECMTKTTSVPDLLLERYSLFGLDEAELVLFLRILLRCKNSHCFTINDLQVTHDNNDYMQNVLAAFCQKGLLTEADDGLYSLEGFFRQLWEIWCYEKSCSQCYKKRASASAGSKTQSDKNSRRDFAAVYNLFEKELARGLSPIESEKLSKWLDEDGFSTELIKEALQRAVLQGKPYFNYIDKILLNWQSQSLHTIADVKAKDNHPAGKKKTSSSAKKTATKSEYSAIYDKILKP